MNTTYIQVDFNGLGSEATDILVARLAEAGWEGFEENEQRFSAYIPKAGFDPAILDELAAGHPYQLSEVPYTNWNKQWESSFDPVLVDEFCAVRAGFHKPVTEVRHEIIITPKQSFGTGHHATTWLMMKRMEGVDFKDKKVFDFGTGTGVLAILAEKCGAGSVLGIDIDEWSMENAAENGMDNHCERIVWKLSDHVPETGAYDIILANINKNVITAHAKGLADRLTSGGLLLLSGLLAEDEMEIRAAMEKQQLLFLDLNHRNGWICLAFKG